MLTDLSPPPRRIPPALWLRVWSRVGEGPFFAWLWIAMTLPIAVGFSVNADFLSARQFASGVREVQGVSLRCEETSHREGGGAGRPVFANRYRFTSAEGAYEGVSYVVGRCASAGEAVPVEYVEASPEVSRIRGTRRKLFHGSVVSATLMPLLGLVGLLLSVPGRMRVLRLLRDGQFATGTFVGTEPTRRSYRGNRIMRARFAFTARDGQAREAHVDSTMPQTLERKLRILHDPTAAVDWERFPERESFDDQGRLRDPGTRGVITALVLPAISLLGALVALVAFAR